MSLLSAYDDLVERSVRAVPGTLEKVRFLCRLRGSSNSYEHWGLERTYGKAAAQDAMEKAHTEAVLVELSTPVSRLWNELLMETNGKDDDLAQFAASLDEVLTAVPADLAGGSDKHHAFIMKSLCLLVRNQRQTTHQAA